MPRKLSVVERSVMRNVLAKLDGTPPKWLQKAIALERGGGKGKAPKKTHQNPRARPRQNPRSRPWNKTKKNKQWPWNKMKNNK
eukprot:4776834-Amphidinium_carterae.1